MTFQKSFLSPLKLTKFQEKCIVVTDVVMTKLVPAESVNTCVLITLLAHLSQRLKGELIVYEGICRPSVVCRLSTFSNDISSKAVRPILFIFHI